MNIDIIIFLYIRTDKFYCFFLYTGAHEIRAIQENSNISVAGHRCNLTLSNKLKQFSAKSWFPPNKFIQIPGLFQDFPGLSRSCTNSNNKIYFCKIKTYVLSYI